MSSTQDQAEEIIFEANVAALNKCRDAGIECAAAYQELLRQTIRTFAHLIDDPKEALRQAEAFLCEENPAS